jgi:hypothetical protein
MAVDVEIDAGNIGGPSAGLMWALGLYDLLTPGDLTDGRIIAGTGQIALDGTVIPIAGIEDVPHYVETKAPREYRGRRVFVIGKRNSGFEIADGLLPWARQVVLGSPRPAQVAVIALSSVRVRYLQPYEDWGLGGGTFALDVAIERIERRGDGWFVEPTIFDNVAPGMRLFKEEVFGPVLSISTASNLQEALSYANGVEYGLTTSIFTENIDTIMNFVEEVETGMVHVNEPTIGGEAQLPFGGTTASDDFTTGTIAAAGEAGDAAAAGGVTAGTPRGVDIGSPLVRLACQSPTSV